MCFNPHTHAGCDTKLETLVGIKFVSIHTPTQGVTEVNPEEFGLDSVSIHTPTQGVTNSIFPRILILVVSIHTPTQGVTNSIFPRILILVVSIHTPTQGVTNLEKQADGKLGFQSTHPRRVWLVDVQCKGATFCFNPHTHAGCDDRYNEILSKMFVSIHTPTQGVTLENERQTALLQFQSTHPRRVWHNYNIWLYVRRCFNPHTHAGCDIAFHKTNRW